MVKRYLLTVYTICIFAPLIQASITWQADKTSGCGPLVVKFSSDAPSSSVLFWEFGNGNTSTLASPSAIYYSGGRYTVKLMVTHANGSVVKLEKTDYIEVFSKPQPDFTIASPSGCLPYTVDLKSTGTSGTPITKWAWDLGQGFASGQENPSITITSAGVFPVTLAVWDANNCTNVITKTGQVTVYKPPYANFNARGNLACDVPATATFADKSINYYPGNLTYKWDFGSGNTSVQKSPQALFNVAGAHSISLTVTDANGCSGTMTKDSFVFIGKPVASFDIPSRKICVPDTITFINTTTGMSNLTFSWVFQPGDTQTNATHLFKTPGVHKVKLIARSQAGCVSEMEKEITVYQKPAVDFVSANRVGCKIPHEVTLTPVGTGFVEYSWSLGRKSSSAATPVFTLADTGLFTVSLTVKDINGCVSQLTKSDFVWVSPSTVEMDFDREAGCAPLPVQFWSKIYTPGIITKISWNFGDSTSFSRNPAYIFKDTGRHLVTLTVEDNLGCKIIRQHTIKAGIRPAIPDFEADRREGCVKDLAVKFTNKTSEIPVKPDAFSWTFAADLQSGEKNPYVIYDTDPGWYDVTLHAYHLGCSSMAVKRRYIQVKGGKARIEIQSARCDPDSVKIINRSVGGHTFQWRLTDRTTGQLMVDTFSRDLNRKFPMGNFDVWLEVTDTISRCVNSTKGIIYIPAPFSADFTNIKKACAPERVTFKSASNYIQYKWTLSDGRTFNVREPEMEFKEPGTYGMTLRVWGANGCEKEMYKPDALIVYGSFIASEVTPPMGCAPHSITMRDSSFSWYPIKAKWWDMGDGNTIPVTSEYMSYRFEKVPYDQGQGYKVRLRVQDSSGCISSKEHKILVLKPRPNIRAIMQPSCVYPEYQFSSYETPYHGYGPLTYQWSLGPDSSDASQPTLVYDKEGNYLVKVVMKDFLGCSGEDTFSLNIAHRKLVAGFWADNVKQDCPPMFVNFKDSTVPGYAPVKKYFWEFGDNNSSELKDPGKLYPVPGLFDVALTVTDEFGCTSTVYKEKLIKLGGPIGTFTFSPDRGCEPLEVKFVSQTRGATKVQWDPGDGNLLEGDSVTHLYTRPGNYTPMMILSDDKGCTYALPPDKKIDVYPAPISDFSVNIACSEKSSQFINLSESRNMNNIGSVNWHFGDGDSSDVFDTEHTYKRPGKYTIKLIISGRTGCFDTASKEMDVHGVVAHLATVDSFGCVGMPVDFKASFEEFQTRVIAMHWDFGDGTVSDSFTRQISHTYFNRGKYNLSYKVFSDKGCENTFYTDGFVVGDTQPPAPPVLYYVSVENDREIQVAYSAYQEADLGAYLAYRIDPDNRKTLVFTGRDTRDTSFMDRELLTTQHVYRYFVRNKNICGYTSYEEASEIHATMELKTTPDTNRVNLEWTHYKGWDSVNRYVVLRSPGTADFDSIGFVSGSINRYVDSAVICHQQYAYRIRAVEDEGYKQVSMSDTARVRPFHRKSTPVGEILRVSAEGENNVVIEWVKPMRVRYSIDSLYLERSINNVDFKLFSVKSPDLLKIDNPAQTSVRPYYYRMRLKDSCLDLGDYSPVTKTIFLHVDTTMEEKPFLHWNSYQGWKQGISEYEVYRLESSGNFEKIASVAGTDSVYVDLGVAYNGREDYCYRVRATRGGTLDSSGIFSWSNPACAKVSPRLFIPNAFTPNGDPLNDFFQVKGVFIKTYEINIYNRWGQLIYTGTDMERGWDGTYRNEPVSPDVFMYRIEAVGTDNEPLFYSGTITLLR